MTHHKAVAERIKPTSKGLILKDFISIAFWMTKSELENRIACARGYGWWVRWLLLRRGRIREVLVVIILIVMGAGEFCKHLIR